MGQPVCHTQWRLCRVCWRRHQPAALAAQSTRSGIEKRGDLYTFKYRDDDSGDPTWITLGTYTASDSVEYIGLLERTFDSGLGNACLFDVDTFQLERYGSAAPTRTPTPTATATSTETATATHTERRKFLQSCYH